MRNENKRTKLFARRALALISIKLGVLFALFSRLYYLQVLRADEYKTLSDSNRIKLFLMPPLRGTITDRFQKVIATNQIDYRILLSPHEANNLKATAEKVADVLGVSPDRRALMLRRVNAHRGQQPIVLLEHLSWSSVTAIEVNTPDLPGVSIEAGQVRFYPLRNIASHLIGYIGAISEAELIKYPMLRHPDFKIGKSGIEKSLDFRLRGEAGVRKMEVNVHGMTVRELSREESKSGDKIALTIDSHLQAYAYNRLLEAKSASAIVVHIPTGDILAMASAPSFDPNKFTGGIPATYWKELLNDPTLPLIDKAIAQHYPPGSTFKTMTALAGLSSGIDPNRGFFCPGYYTLGNVTFRCWKEGGHGHVNMRQALAYSCDVYFYSLARLIGIDAIEQMSKHFGLGKVVGIEIQGEKPGLIPSRDWKKGQYGVSWQQGDTLNTSIGQGFVLTTPLQLATMTARLGSKGKMVHPHLLCNSDKTALPQWKDMGIPEKYFDVVLEGMNGVSNVPGGTAYGSRITDPRYALMGKTGTSQVVSRKRYEKNPTPLSEWKHQNHALFIAVAPVEKPQYAIAVVVEHGMAGSKAAAPIGRDILWRAQAWKSGEDVPDYDAMPDTLSEHA